MRFAAFALAANVVGLCIAAALVERPLVAARILRYYWFRQADVAVPMATALATTLLVVQLFRRRSWSAIGLAAVPIAACVWFLAATSFGRMHEPRPPAVAKMAGSQDWQDACRWIAANTPAEARFLTPRSGHSFTWYASRADVANYKDVPQDAASVVEWRRRCQDLFPTVEGVDGEPRMLSSPEQLGTDRVRALAEKYGATHVIARSYPPLDLPVAYPRGEGRFDRYYTVYKIEAADAEPSP